MSKSLETRSSNSHLRCLLIPQSEKDKMYEVQLRFRFRNVELQPLYEYIKSRRR